MESTTQAQANPNEELSLKLLILKIREWVIFILKKWVLILIVGLAGGVAGFTYAYLKKPSFLAELTFVLEESKAGGLAGYAGIASQLGIDIAGANGSGVFSGDNILEFLRSRLMVQKTLLSPVTINGKETSLADLYVNISGLGKAWENNPELKNIKFPASANRAGFSMLQDSVLNVIYLKINKEALIVSKPDKKLSFVSVKCASKDQFFSKLFVEKLVKEATDFYVETKTKRSKTNVDKLQQKADSIEILLNRKTYSAAASQDLNMNPGRNIARVNTEVVTRDKIVLQTIYGEVVKNLEVSRMSMVQETPIIQIVDIPILPLKEEKLGKIKGAVIGGILGGFLIIIVLVIGRFYKELMS